MIEVENLSKRYGDKLAVDRLSFSVPAGTVTGFLGPNGAGKSTTMRMIAALDEPTTGRVPVNGKDYRAAAAPMAELGILLAVRKLAQGQQSFVTTLRAQPECRLLTQIGAAFRRGERHQHFGCPRRRMHAQGCEILLDGPAVPASAVAKRSGILGKLAEKCSTVFRVHIGQPLKR